MLRVYTPMFRPDTGKTEVGLAYDSVLRERNPVQVEIMYTRKNGTRIYPNIFEISKSKIDNYPKKVIKGRRLVYIPLDEMNEVIVR